MKKYNTIAMDQLKHYNDQLKHRNAIEHRRNHQLKRFLIDQLNHRRMLSILRTLSVPIVRSIALINLETWLSTKLSLKDLK